ncbi:ribosome maturation factor RimM [Anaerobacillus arseniciselenatis]|uniref:Ribosome maturation factor RimM n=1 Tax=Anaerobacillus arseniciselenatis TaxID=85682 RepID=A0A1S2LC95_9BACI|nr:ribosome maturation factor RimM [Anaerobacillus arseniciselenatis]OIJ09880.1 ribosome maturation factor RimM [Anaerobacillus arseniciselenatis]
MIKWFNVGKVVNTHGVRGEVRVIATTDFPEERFTVGSKLYLEHENLNGKLPLIVTSHREHKNFNLLTFENYPNINDVEAFKGGILQIREDQLSDLDEEEYYYYEIIGCDVMTEEGEHLGKIKEILSPGANDVWVIQRKNGGKDLLIPYIEQVVKKVNVNEKEVVIHLMEGLE